MTFRSAASAVPSPDGPGWLVGTDGRAFRWEGRGAGSDEVLWAGGQRPTPDGDKARLLATSAGHQILIDEDANEMKLVHPGGAAITLDADGITLTMGACELKITSTEISLNNGMVKVTTAGASLVNDAFKVGA